MQAFGSRVDVAFFARGQPFFFRAPVDFFQGMPDVFAAKTEAKGLQSHGLIDDRARTENQVGPAQTIAVFFLDGPEQAPGFVQVDIIWPGIERGEALMAGRPAAAAVGGAIGPG